MKSQANPVAVIMAAVLLCSATAAKADQVIKAGEWAVTDTVNGKGPAETQKICRATDRTVADVFTRSLTKSGAQCSKKTFDTNGHTVTFELSCKVSGMQVTMHGTHTWTGEDAYHIDYHTHYAGAPQGMPTDISRTGDAKRLGP